MTIVHNSSLVKAYHFNPETGELTLVLKSGTVVYKDTPAELAAGLDAAESKGKFYNSDIKKSGLSFDKVSTIWQETLGAQMGDNPEEIKQESIEVIKSAGLDVPADDVEIHALAVSILADRLEAE